MKWIFTSFLAIILIITGCKKDADDNASLTGTWVDKDHPLDTVVVYRKNGRTFIFDNSAIYRAGRATWPGDDFYRFQIQLKGDSIGFKRFDAPAREPFFFYHFQWVKYKEEFEMPYNGMRPVMSVIRNGHFVKVK